MDTLTRKAPRAMPGQIRRPEEEQTGQGDPGRRPQWRDLAAYQFLQKPEPGGPVVDGGDGEDPQGRRPVDGRSPQCAPQQSALPVAPGDRTADGVGTAGRHGVPRGYPGTGGPS